MSDTDTEPARVTMLTMPFCQLPNKEELAVMYTAFSALTLLVGWQEWHPACKKMSGSILVWLSVWGKEQICIWPS